MRLNAAFLFIALEKLNDITTHEKEKLLRTPGKMNWKPWSIFIHASMPVNAIVQFRLHGMTRKGDSQTRQGAAQILATHFGPGKTEFEAIFSKTSTHPEKASEGEKQTKIHVVMRNCLSSLVCTEAEVVAFGTYQPKPCRKLSCVLPGGNCFMLRDDTRDTAGSDTQQPFSLSFPLYTCVTAKTLTDERNSPYTLHWLSACITSALMLTRLTNCSNPRQAPVSTLPAGPTLPSLLRQVKCHLTSQTLPHWPWHKQGRLQQGSENQKLHFQSSPLARGVGILF